MKININPFHRLTTWLCIGIVGLFVVNASPKPTPRNDSAGCGIAIAVLVCGGVVVYVLVRTCKKVFGTNTNRFDATWQSPRCVEIVSPCNCGPALVGNSSGVFHELQRSINLTNWETIDTQWGDLDKLDFYDRSPPASASYRIASW